jgi:tetratricopeptide (TPR) repeat protein
LSVAAFYVFARYRLPLAPMLILIAAGGLSRIGDFQGILSRGRLAGASVAGLAAAGVALLPLRSQEAVRVAEGIHYFNIATEVAQDPERGDLALQLYRRALSRDPRSPGAHVGIGVLLARSGRHHEAVAEYRAALAVWPDYVEAHFNLAQSLAAAGRFEEAVGHYRRALASGALPPPAQAKARVALEFSLTQIATEAQRHRER